ncbi:hypothetical protein MKK84_04590, partial [Methylobacterium sp. E-065]|uniref:ABC transporter permease subunit n=1 Tax=Methylobacterium sp. E-065 TaxID=2836583 RepID=UPI00391AD5D7|nr:hypothetical protein [Methylobacterium sp. E-065]
MRQALAASLTRVPSPYPSYRRVCPPPQRGEGAERRVCSLVGPAQPESPILLPLDTLTTSAILFSVSIGVLAIFGVLTIINFAHGAWLTVGAYCAVLTAKRGPNPWASLPLAFVVGAALAW